MLSALLWLIALGLPVLIGIAWQRGRKVSSGVAGALAEVSEMLNPSQPSAEMLASVREGEQDEDSDDDPDPKD